MPRNKKKKNGKHDETLCWTWDKILNNIRGKNIVSVFVYQYLKKK